MTTSLHPVRLQFSGHETFPLRQLWLRKAYCAVVDSDSSGKSVSPFAEESAIRRFGVGKNMVSAIRHWALACDVIQEGQIGAAEISAVGEFLFGSHGIDPYLEHDSTPWLVHWLLAGRATRSSTCYWIFNRLIEQTFTRDAIHTGLAAYAKSRGAKVSAVTLKRDIEVCLRCYVPRRDGREIDDLAEPLLAELGLITEGANGVLQFRRGHHLGLSLGVFTFALIDFWRLGPGMGSSGQSTLSFDAIAHEYGSPGRVFKLDENAVAERLSCLEEFSRGALRWNDSAGVRQVSRHASLEDERLQYRLLRKGYGN